MEPTYRSVFLLSRGFGHQDEMAPYLKRYMAEFPDRRIVFLEIKGSLYFANGLSLRSDAEIITAALDEYRYRGGSLTPMEINALKENRKV